jgi:hypothetical protein
MFLFASIAGIASCESEEAVNEVSEDSLSIQEKTITIPASDSLANPRQAQAAEEFFQAFLQQNTGACWKIFDTVANKGLTKKQFEASVKTIFTDLPQKDRGFTFYKKGIRSGMGSQNLIVYTYRYKIDLDKLGQPYPPHVLEVIFTDDQSLLVAGFLKTSITEEAGANFTESVGDYILSSDTTWTIGSEKVKIKFVDLATFHERLGLLLVKVEQPLTGKDPKGLKEQGLKLAKLLYTNGTYKTGQERAEDMKVYLVKELGVCFADPQTGREYNVLFEEKDYK